MLSIPDRPCYYRIMTKKVRRLFNAFAPDHYTLTLDPDISTKTIRGEVTISGHKRGRPSQRLTFHQNGLKITSAAIIQIDKKGAETEIPVVRINHHKSLDEVRLHASQLLYPGAYRIRLAFNGVITDAMHGIYPCYYEHEGKKQALVATQFESPHAREAFPCIDEPEAKATFDLTLISPAGQTALGNMPAKQSEEKDGKLHTTFETTPKMSTYLLAFVYGDMQHKEATTKDGVTVRVWATRAQESESLDFGLDIGVRSIEFFNEYFDVPYPLPKCDHVALPDFASGAMENWGLLTYREICLLAHPEKTSQSMREFVAMIVAHEVSHQWFGDLVTMKWWDDLWLNESFANVMEYLAPARLIPEWNFWDAFVTNEGLSAFRRDSIAGVQAVKTEIRHPDDISSIFDPSIVYAKGGRLLHMLFEYIGEDALRRGLKAYFTKHAYANTTGDDLWQALSDASGQDLGSFMQPWLHQPGFPVIRVRQDGAHLSISQSHFLLDASKADKTRIWPVPLLPTTTDIPALLQDTEITVTLQSDDYVRINKDAIGHYIVSYENPEHAAAIAQQAEAKQLTVPERLMLLSDTSMLARAGLQPFADTLKLLEHYRKEDNEAVWDIMTLVIADLRRFVDIVPELESAIKAMLRALIGQEYQRLGWSEHPGESAADTKLRATIIGLGAYARHSDILAQGLKRYEAYRKGDEAIVSSELRGIIFGIAIREQAEGAFDELLAVEEATSNAELKQDIVSALALSRDQDRIQQLLGRLQNADKVRPQDLDRNLIYLMRNRHAREAAWRWLRDNWQWIEQTFSGDKTYDNFPRYAAACFNTRALLEEYKAFFGTKQDIPALSRNILMGIEELENRVVWLERDLGGVQQYFADSK